MGILSGGNSEQTTNYNDSSQTLGLQDSDGSNAAGGDQTITNESTKNTNITQTDSGSIKEAFRFGSDALGANTDTTARSLDSADNAFNRVLSFAGESLESGQNMVKSAISGSRSEGAAIVELTARQRTKQILIIAGTATALGAVFFIATRGK